MLQPIHLIYGSLGLLSVAAGTFHKISKIFNARKESKELEKAVILQEAKEYSQKKKIELESQLKLIQEHFDNEIKAIHQKINNLQEAVSKDLAHVKESYNSELKFLGDKITELKDEMRTQMTQVVNLIGKLIDKT